jgi:hypothetical protein
LIVASFVIYSQLKPLSVCTNLIADK